MSHLILGGARSGKSRYAENLANQSGLPVCYVATAQIYDEEMAQRVRQHQADRPQSWVTIEATLDLAQVIRGQRQKQRCVLVDCLTLWLMGVLDNESDMTIEQRVDELLQAILDTEGPLLLVSNEISMGVVPMGQLSRRFVDELGRLHQTLAAHVDEVTLMVAGLPLDVKSSSPSESIK